MDPLPGKGLVRAYNVGAEGSMKAAAAPWQALGGVGEMIAGLGERGAQMIVKHQELAVQRKAADMELEFDQLQADYQKEVLANPNMTPEQAIAGWEQRAQPFQAKYNGEGSSQLEQDVLGTRAKQLTVRGGMGVAKSAMLAGIQNSKQSAINLITRGEQTGNDEMRQQGFGMLGQVMPEADLESEKMKSDSRVMTTRVESEIMADPIGMRDRLQDPNFVKNHPGVSVDQIPRLQEQARGAANRAVGDSVDNFSDGVATNRIKTPDDIDREFSHVPPRIREQMKGELSKRYNEAEKIRLKSPEVQSQIVGQASSMMQGIAGAPDFEERYANASFLLDSLEDSPTKRMLTEQLRETKTGREAEVKTHADAAMKALDAANSNGMFGSKPAPQPMKTSDAVQAGFLNDPAKLKAIGFDDDQIAAIAKEKSNEARTRKFQEFRTARPNKATADNLTWKTAEAIWSGSDKIDHVSPEATRQEAISAVESQTRYGKAKIEFMNWSKMNPEASAKDIDDKVFELAGEEARKSLSSGIFDAKPTRATAGARITSYGYAADSTPDSNSAAGIGAWVGDDEAQAIKSGKDTPNKLKPGDFAVSPDEEAVLRSAGISPGDAVSLKVSDGSTVTGRWMDRTAAEYKGRKLTGRYDVYSPDGKHALDGKSVVGFIRDTVKKPNQNTGEFSEYNVR